MNTRALPAPGKGLAPWLFAAAVLLFWFCLIAASLLYGPRKNRLVLEPRVYALDAQAVQGVRRVVLDLPAFTTTSCLYVREAEVRWTDAPGIRISAEEPAGQGAQFEWLRQGETLILRPLPTASAPAPEMSEIWNVPAVWRQPLEVQLPPQVQFLQAPQMDVEIHTAAPLGTLQLQGYSLRLQQGAVDDLQMLGMGSNGAKPESCPNGVRSPCFGTKVAIDDAVRVRRLRIDSAGSQVDIGPGGQLESLALRTLPSSAVRVQMAHALALMRWQPLPEQEQARLQPDLGCAP